MKNLDLNKYGVKEMNAGEMRENNGGYGNVVWFILGAIYSELNDPNSWNDMKNGYHAARNNQ